MIVLFIGLGCRHGQQLKTDNCAAGGRLMPPADFGPKAPAALRAAS